MPKNLRLYFNKFIAPAEISSSGNLSNSRGECPYSDAVCLPDSLEVFPGLVSGLCRLRTEDLGGEAELTPMGWFVALELIVIAQVAFSPVFARLFWWGVDKAGVAADTLWLPANPTVLALRRGT
jgi:hypothetical protein